MAPVPYSEITLFFCKVSIGDWKQTEHAQTTTDISTLKVKRPIHFNRKIDALKAIIQFKIDFLWMYIFEKGTIS